MKRTISLLLALACMFSLTSMAAFSATTTPSTFVKITRVTITASTTTLRVGQMSFLDVKIRPDNATYDSIEWFTTDGDVVDVNEYGDVEALEEGTAYVYARIIGTDDKGRTDRRLATGEILLTVLPERSTAATSSSGSSGLDKDTGAGGTSNLLGKIPAATVTNAVKSVVKRGATTNAIFRNYETISASTIASAATAMNNAGGTVLLNFDTLNSTGNAVEGRVAINPKNAANVKGDLALGVYTNSNATGSTRTKFERFFTNQVVIIKAMQKGSYGTGVTYAVKIGTALSKSKQLMLYSYDPATNKYYTVKNSNIRIDANGYVHFTTSLGDYLVISDGPLKLR